MIPGSPNRLLRIPNWTLMKIDPRYVMGNRPRRWSMKVSFKERDLLLFSINPLPVSVYNGFIPSFNFLYDSFLSERLGKDRVRFFLASNSWVYLSRAKSRSKAVQLSRGRPTHRPTLNQIGFLPVFCRPLD
jgi:hypothetical protein